MIILSFLSLILVSILLIQRKLLVDVRFEFGVKLTNMCVGPVFVVNFAPSYFHLINTAPSLEIAVFENGPSMPKTMPTFKISVFNQVLKTAESLSGEFDVIYLLSIINI